VQESFGSSFCFTPKGIGKECEEAENFILSILRSIFKLVAINYFNNIKIYRHLFQNKYYPFNRKMKGKIKTILNPNWPEP